MTMTERWELAERVGDSLGLTKATAFAGLAMLDQYDLIDGILKKDPETIERALTLQWHGYHGQKSVEKREESKAKQEFRGNAGDVQIMIWAIKKIGNYDRALDAFNRAALALK